MKKLIITSIAAIILIAGLMPMPVESAKYSCWSRYRACMDTLENDHDSCGLILYHCLETGN